MAVLAFAWHAQMDDRTCPICKELNGYTWYFDTREGVEVLSSTGLWHPSYTKGPVWSVQKGSSEHGPHANCRCSIEYDESQSDMSDLVEAARDMLRAIEDGIAEGDKKGDEVQP